MDTTVDEALQILEGCGPEFSFGKSRLSNHGPMAAEALIALGRPDAVVPWVEQYKRGLEEAPEARNAIPRDDWQEAFGDVRRVGDWSVFFQRELADSPWRTVLDTWVGRLAPGIVASATHGVIRTGHAVRSLEKGETPLRKRELAEGLAYWAATYMLLPGRPGQPSNYSPREALRTLETLPPPEQVPGNTITAYLLRLDSLASFPSAIDLVDPRSDSSRFLSDLTELFAGVYLENAGVTGHVIGLIHTVTGPSAVRLLAPSLSPETTALTLRYAWQAAAGMYAAMARGVGEDSFAWEGDRDDLTDQAVSTGDEHAIKFTEACLREYALNDKPVYLAAALDASRRLGPR